jgi:1-acyl-sn-glycerol-3-phosphate acyltransferase
MLWLQRSVVWLCTPLLYGGMGVVWMRWVRRYRVPEMARIRAQYRALWKEVDGPLLICPNHLTLIDSYVLGWAVLSVWDALLHPSRLAWHLPEKRNVSESLLFRFACYIGKAIQVVRRGTPSETQFTKAKLQYLLSHGQTIEVFPEATRSRSGRVDTENFDYAVGRLCLNHPGARVLCAYVRGQEQETWGQFPKRGEAFFIELRLVTPRAEHQGLRGAREIATQVIQELADMERQYFEHRTAP